MRSGGINWLAVIVAAIAIYLLGFVIYGVLIPEDRLMAMMETDEAHKAIAMSRMAFSPVMPLLTAIFMAVIFKWANVSGAMTGAKWAVAIGFASAVPTVLYGWVYGGMSTDMALVDGSHLLLGHIAAGAILGSWK